MGLEYNSTWKKFIIPFHLYPNKICWSCHTKESIEENLICLELSSYHILVMAFNVMCKVLSKENGRKKAFFLRSFTFLLRQTGFSLIWCWCIRKQKKKKGTLWKRVTYVRFLIIYICIWIYLKRLKISKIFQLSCHYNNGMHRPV